MNGSSNCLSGAFKASFIILANAIFGTSFLSNGTGSPPVTTWKTPFVVLLSFLGLCTTPCLTLCDLMLSDVKEFLSGAIDISLDIPCLSTVNDDFGS